MRERRARLRSSISSVRDEVVVVVPSDVSSGVLGLDDLTLVLRWSAGRLVRHALTGVSACRVTLIVWIVHAFCRSSCTLSVGFPRRRGLDLNGLLVLCGICSIMRSILDKLAWGIVLVVSKLHCPCV